MTQKFWGGFYQGELHLRECYGWLGYETKYYFVPAIYLRRKHAKQHYKDVRKIEVRVVGAKAVRKAKR
jgi:hypothetical protein